MSHKTAATVAHTIGIDTSKNTLHLIGLDEKGAIVLREIDVLCKRHRALNQCVELPLPIHHAFLMKGLPGICPAASPAQNSSEIKKTAAAPVLPRLSAVGLVWSLKIGSVTRNMKPVAEKTQKKHHFQPSQLAQPRPLVIARSRQALMKIVFVVVGLLFIVLGLFLVRTRGGVTLGPHNAVLIEGGAGVAALGIGLVWFAFR